MAHKSIEVAASYGINEETHNRIKGYVEGNGSSFHPNEIRHFWRVYQEIYRQAPEDKSCPKCVKMMINKLWRWFTM